jgi:hypothetical protein
MGLDAATTPSLPIAAPGTKGESGRSTPSMAQNCLQLKELISGASDFPRHDRGLGWRYSHSIVLGGLELMS